ncbi:MAG: PstS family phosphate ABC transporter substrate-binding protein [Xenococcaceae cyanobacterium]
MLWFLFPARETWSKASVQNQKLGKSIRNNPVFFQHIDNVPSGIFNYGGSTSWAPIRKIVDPIIQTTWSEYKLRYTSPVIGNPGSSTGIRMLLEDQLSFAQSSRPLTEKEFEQAKTRGFSLKQIPVAIDGIAIAVNPNLQIPGLTLAQLQDIYTGKLTSWKQVGGSDLPIVPYSRNVEEGGTVAFFVNNVLEGKKFGDNLQLVKNTTEGLRKVISNPGGIYYATIPEVIHQCKIKPLPIGRKQEELISPYQKPYVSPSQCPEKRNQININALQSGEYPITRRLFVIVKQNGQRDENAGLAYEQLLLSEQGQELIGQAGFIPIH